MAYFYKINILFVRNLENDFKNFTIIRNIKYLKKNKIINKLGISIYNYENIVKGEDVEIEFTSCGENPNTINPSITRKKGFRISDK